MHFYIYFSIIYNGQDLEAAQVSIIELVDKKAVVYFHNGILCGHGKERNLTLCDSMHEPGEHYAK